MPFDFESLSSELTQLTTGELNNKPRPNMKGLTVLAGGFLAGYEDNTICFSKAYLPHAWPVNYEITVNGNINSIAYASSGLVVTTDKNPYLISGSSPDAMFPIQLDITEPCIAPKATVDMGAFVIYVGNDGLYAIAGSDNRNLINGLLDKDDWRETVSTNAVACMFNGKYWYFSENGGFVYDPLENIFSKHSMSAKAVYSDKLNDQIYLVDYAGNLKKYSRDNLASSALQWKSKIFRIDGGILSCGKINADDSVYLTLDYYYKNNLIHTYSVSVSDSSMFRLPSKLSSHVQVTLSSTDTINRIQLASSAAELI
ncbi:hypothetical protein THIOSC15_820004 [uncultured Thiomicrorhabdus sp.]